MAGRVNARAWAPKKSQILCKRRLPPGKMKQQLRVHAQTPTGIPSPAKSKVEETKPMGKRVLVQPERSTERTAAGLVLSASTGGEESGVARVLQVGEDVDDPSITVNAKVLYLYSLASECATARACFMPCELCCCGHR